MRFTVSGRTDIVAFYMDWFIKRLEDGYVDVRNPFYPKQVNRIIINKETIDAIIFCTKNPLPLLKYIDKINYPFIVHITLTPYHKDIEPNVLDKKRIITAIKKISSIIGKERVIIRYDPIFFSEKYNLNYHKKAFKKVCEELKNYTSRIIVSFLDLKKNTLKNRRYLNMVALTKENMEELASYMGKMAIENNITITTCGELDKLERFGFAKRPCTDQELIYKITNKNKKYKQSKNRDNCTCIETVDIGEYNTCPHFCKYCYANFDEESVISNVKKHSATSSILIGKIESDDEIKIRKK